MTDFYEEDEPVEVVEAAFEQGNPGVTGRGLDFSEVDWSTVRVENNRFDL